MEGATQVLTPTPEEFQTAMQAAEQSLKQRQEKRKSETKKRVKRVSDGKERRSSRQKPKRGSSTKSRVASSKPENPIKKQRKPSVKRGEKKMDLEAVERLKKRAARDGGVPRPSKLPKQKLSKPETLLKYRYRISMIPSEQFKCLDGKWISTYHSGLTKKHPSEFKEGNFHYREFEILNEVALQKGVTMKGLLPHNSSVISGTTLKSFDVRDTSVEEEFVQQYKDLGYHSVVGDRVYVGTKHLRAGRDDSPFAVLSVDSKPDDTWYTLEESLKQLKKQNPQETQQQ